MKKKLPKILHIITGLQQGGAEQALYNLIKGGLVDHFSNHIVSLSDDGYFGAKFRDLGVNVTALGILKLDILLPSLIKLKGMVRDVRPDIIQGWMYHGNFFAYLAFFFSGRASRLAWNVRHSLYRLNDEKFVTRQVIRINRNFSNVADRIIYNSQAAKILHENFGFASRGGISIPNGIDLQKFSHSPSSFRKIRHEFKIPGNAIVLGHVARLHPLKGHIIFLKAAVTLASQYKEVRVLLSGRNVSLDYKPFREVIPQHMRHRFHLLGERRDVSDLMSAIDIFCQSSFSESFPNVLGEAMSTQTPCVATDVGDCKKIIGDTGVVVKPRDLQSLIAGLKCLLSKSIEERSALGVLARNQIEKKYALPQILEKYNSMYEQMLKEIAFDRKGVE